MENLRMKYDIQECDVSIFHRNFIRANYLCLSDYVFDIQYRKCDFCEKQFTIPDTRRFNHGRNYDEYTDYIKKHHKYKHSIGCKLCINKIIVQNGYKKTLERYNKIVGDILYNIEKSIEPNWFNINPNEAENFDVYFNIFLVKLIKRNIKDEEFRKRIRTSEYLNELFKRRID